MGRGWHHQMERTRRRPCARSKIRVITKECYGENNVRTRVQFASSVALVLAIFAGCSGTSTEPPPKTTPPAQVHLVRSKRGDATRSVVLPANVLPYQQATLYAKVGGYVKAVTVDKGDAVKEGALLADIEVPELIADRAKYQAELEVAAVDYKRVSEAQAKAPDLVIPQAVDTAKGKSDIAKANLERIDTLLGYAKITAPFAGVITRRMVDPGAFIPAATSGSAAQNAAMFTLMDFSRVRVQVAVPETEVPFIKDGLPVSVSIQELRRPPLEGAITRYSQALDDSTKTMLAEIELANPKGEVHPGMYAHVRIVVETKPGALLLPTDAVFAEKSRSSVFMVADNKAKRLTVKTGFNDAGWIEILDALSPEQPVILIGKQTLTDGQPVTVVEGK